MLTALNRHQSLVIAAKLAGFYHINLSIYSHSIETVIFCYSDAKQDDARELALQYASEVDSIEGKDLSDFTRNLHTVKLRTDLI